MAWVTDALATRWADAISALDRTTCDSMVDDPRSPAPLRGGDRVTRVTVVDARSLPDGRALARVEMVVGNGHGSREAYLMAFTRFGDRW